MGIISSSWVIEQNKNLFCYWPSYLKLTAKREKAVMYHEALQKDKCALCPIGIKFTSDDYSIVIPKLKALEDAQESQTESEFEDNNRHHKSNKYSDYACSSDDNIEILPKAPQPPKLGNKDIKAKDKNPQLFKKMQETISHLGSFLSTCKNSFLQYQNNTLTDTAMPYQKKLAKPQGIGSSGSSFASDAIRTDEALCQTCKSNEAVMRELVKTVEKLREDIKFLILLNQDKDSDFIGTYEKESFQTLEELGKFDKDLENDEEYLQKTCIRLSLVGERDEATVTRKILATIISHNLALKLNWSGRNEKGGLKEYASIIKCIAAAVRRKPNSKSYTNDDIHGSIKAWLRNAADRDGGRSKRSNNKVI